MSAEWSEKIYFLMIGLGSLHCGCRFNSPIIQVMIEARPFEIFDMNGRR